MPTRRAFLAGSLTAAGAVALASAPSTAAAAPVAAATPAASLPLLTGPYPRAFSFRQSEVLAELWNYRDWAAALGRLDGVMAKVLQEEKTRWSGPRQLSYLTRFAREHPEQAVLLHFNGRARRPEYRTAGWSAGDWLYRAGHVLPDPVAATDTVLRVADTTAFDLQPDRLGDLTDDIVLTGRTPDGRPDWDVAEQAVLTAVDAAAGTITVRRAQYGSVALDLPAGGYVAQHLTKGPWSPVDTRVWLYNLATTAPRGPDGRSVAERVATEMAADFGRGGPLARFHGLVLDIFQLYDAERAVVDADGDGVTDAAMVGEVDAYTAGQVDFAARLRTAIGGQRLLVVDGAIGQRPDFASIDGIEEEGFPNVLDSAPAVWSQGCDALTDSTVRGRRPQLSYVVAKTRGSVAASFPRFRSALAATLLTGTAVTFWDQTDGGDPLDTTTFPVWDELVGGAGGVVGWLGAPVTPAVRPALAGTDLFGSAGVSMRQAWVDQWVVTGGAVTRRGAHVVLTPDSGAGMTVRLPRVPAPGPDLVLQVDGRVDPAAGLPGTVGRILTVTTVVGRTRVANDLTLAPAWRTVTAAASGLEAGDATVTLQLPDRAPWGLQAIRALAGPDVAARLFEHGAVFVNPSSRPQTFDVASLFPGVALGRLTATAGQDPAVNDGSPVGDTLTLPARDAVVARRTWPAADSAVG